MLWGVFDSKGQSVGQDEGGWRWPSHEAGRNPYLLDPGKVTDKLYGGGKFIPNVYVIDQAGVIRWQRVGNMDLAGADVIAAEVEKLLASPAKM